LHLFGTSIDINVLEKHQPFFRARKGGLTTIARNFVALACNLKNIDGVVIHLYS